MERNSINYKILQENNWANVNRKIKEEATNTGNFITSNNMNDDYNISNIIDPGDYTETSKNIINDMHNLDTSKYDIYNNDYKLNRLGDYKISNTMEYALELYILYCNKLGYDPSNVVKYIIDNNISNSNTLFSSDNNFKQWTLINYNMIDIYVDHLLKMGIDPKNDDVIELYKGKLDAADKERKNLISPYASTLGENNSILYKKDKILFKVTKDNVEKIDDGKTFLIQNPYSVTTLLYLLETLGGTNNKVIVTFWGNANDVNRNKLFLMMNEVISFLNMNVKEDFKINFEENNGVYINSFIMNTKSIKKEVDLSELMTKKEKEILSGESQPKKQRRA